MTNKEIIHKFNLTPHPEGGYFKELYRSTLKTELNLPGKEKRNLATSIYFLLEKEQVSKFHQLDSDEIWYFHYGGTLKIHMIDQQGKYSSVLLGSNMNKDNLFQYTIPAKTIFGAEVVSGDFSLLGCMVAPGFEFSDFRMLKRNELLEKYPDLNNVILKLT